MTPLTTRTPRAAAAAAAASALRVPRRPARPVPKLTSLASGRGRMVELRHPFIVRLLCAFKDSRRLMMAMDYIAGGELWSRLAATGGRVGEEEVRFMDAGQDWQRFFNPGMHRLMSVL